MCVLLTNGCRSFTLTLLTAGLGCVFIGCGRSSPAPTTVSPVPAMQPVRPVAAVPPKPNSGEAAGQKPPGDGTKPGKSQPSDPFANENPRDLFEIAESATPSIVSAAVSEDDLFVADVIDPESHSSQFVVLGNEGTGTRNGQSGLPVAGGGTRAAGFELPEGFTEVASFGYSHDGLPLRIHEEKSGSLMALVPGGLARVGSVDGPSATQPEFTPFLETFYMDVTEVTLGAYGRFRDDTKQKKNSKVQPPLNDGQDAHLPALGVPWGIAQGFAHWAGKELPTEAQFEKAARGPEGFRTPWGPGRAVWPKPRTPETISPVAAFPTDQSVYGIFDLAGNAREWCSDWYSETAHQSAVNVSEHSLRNWPGPKKASVAGQRVVKGNGPDWSVWHRQGQAMTERAADVGFRCALRIKQPDAKESSGD